MGSFDGVIFNQSCCAYLRETFDCILRLPTDTKILQTMVMDIYIIKLNFKQKWQYKILVKIFFQDVILEQISCINEAVWFLKV